MKYLSLFLLLFVPAHAQPPLPKGVTRVVEVLRKEFELAMALTGRPTIASIDKSVLW